MGLIRIIASVFGIGYIGRGSGTLAAVLMLLVWHVLTIGSGPLALQTIILVLLCVIGIYVSNAVEPTWGKDNGKVVIDEVAGMGIALFALPTSWSYVLAALVLFRIFDIFKPLGISRLEQLPKGWGVMGDDILAGIYANVLLQLAALWDTHMIQ